MANSTPAGVHPPLQARSRRTLERILDAAEALLESQTFDDFGVNDICRRAGIPVGSFYARFDGKERLREALYLRYAADVDAFIDRDFTARFRGATLRARVEAIVAERVARFRRRRGLLRALVLHARTNPGHVHGTALEAMNRAHPRYERFVLESREEIRHENPALAVKMAMFFLAAACRDAILFPSSPHAALVAPALKRLERELVRMVLNYLQG